MTYPILEYDSAPEAFIEPSKVMAPRDMPEHCVICYFREVLEKVAAEHAARMLVENKWEDGPHPVYEITHRDRRLAFYHPGVGAPLAGALLEEVIALGCRKFIVCGGCGVLEADIALGHSIVVSEAVRDEGVSYHYLPPGRMVKAHPLGVILYGGDDLSGAEWDNRNWQSQADIRRGLFWLAVDACLGL